MLARVHARVVQIPQLRPLVSGIPLAEAVAEREDALLGAGLFLVAPRAADAGVEAELFDGVEQGHRLVAVAAFVGRAQQHPAAGDGRLDRTHDQPLAELCDAPVAKVDDFGKIVAGVDVQQREGERPRPERLVRQAQQDERILAAGEQQGGVAALAGDFAQDVDRLGLEPAEVVRVGGRRAACLLGARRLEQRCRAHDATPGGATRTAMSSGGRCRPHSRCSGCSHHQRPARGSSPGSTARVQGAQPMDG